MDWYLIGAIFLTGLWGLVAKRNIVKKAMALSITNTAIILLFIYYGSLGARTAPIEGSDRVMADPLPQALMLTAIVVGICILAMALALIYRLYLRFGTLDMKAIERMAWKPHD